MKYLKRNQSLSIREKATTIKTNLNDFIQIGKYNNIEFIIVNNNGFVYYNINNSQKLLAIKKLFQNGFTNIDNIVFTSKNFEKIKFKRKKKLSFNEIKNNSEFVTTVCSNETDCLVITESDYGLDYYKPSPELKSFYDKTRAIFY